MAFDCVPDSDPRGPTCRICGHPIKSDETRTTIQHIQDGAWTSSLVHGECGRPYWDKLTPLMKRLGRGWSR